MHDYGLSSTNDSLIKKDILGNQTRTNSMILYAVNSSLNDFERLQNSSFLIDLCIYLESIKGNPVTQELNGVSMQGELISISCANGMAWEGSEDSQTITYQLQLNVKYKLEG